MSAVIDLSKYFELIESEKLSDAQKLTVPFAFDGTTFDSPEWVLKSDKNAEKEYVLPLANEPITEGGGILGDHPSLLLTVKTALLTLYYARPSGRSTVLGLTVSSPEGIYDLYTVITSLIRYLVRINGVGIFNLRSINQSVAEQILEDLGKKTLIQALDIEARALAKLNELDALGDAPNGFSRYGFHLIRTAKTRGKAKPEFRVELFAAELGLTSRHLQFCMDFQREKVRLLTKYNFDIKPLKNEEVETQDTQGVDTIRRRLNRLQAFMRTLYLQPDLFPEEHRVTQAWLSEVDVDAFARRFGTAEKGKTRNIPKQVFYPMMEHAVIWVLDYADLLIDYRERVKQKYVEFYDGQSKSVSDDKTKWHNAQKSVRPWTQEFQPDGFPYPVVGLTKTSVSKTNPEQVAEAKRLKFEEGLTVDEIAARMGVSISKASLLYNRKDFQDLEGVSCEYVTNSLLVSACLLVIFAFTGRRRDEVMGLKVGCITEESGNIYLNFDQEKVNQGERGLPTTRLVKKAVNVLERLSANSEKGERLLVLKTLKKADGKQEAYPYFNEFCAFVGVTCKDESGLDFSFADHQFRRFLAMTYFFTYKGDLPTLSWFLGHASTLMTTEYLLNSNRELEEAFNEVRGEAILNLVEDCKKNESVVASEIQQSIDELLGDIEIETTNKANLMQQKGKLVEHYQLDFVPDGACFGRTQHLVSRCLCLGTKGLPQLSAAKRHGCVGCPNLIPVDRPMHLEDLESVTIPVSPMVLAIKEGARHE